jgi:hypothetical protein
MISRGLRPREIIQLRKSYGFWIGDFGWLIRESAKLPAIESVALFTRFAGMDGSRAEPLRGISGGGHSQTLGRRFIPLGKGFRQIDIIPAQRSW